MGRSTSSNHDPLIAYSNPEEGRDMIPAEMQIARECLRILGDNFRGYGWCVACDLSPATGGIVKISLPTFMYSTLSYVIHAEKIKGERDMYRAVREAGGEILERLRLRRSGILFPEYRDRIALLPGHGRGLKELPE